MANAESWLAAVVLLLAWGGGPVSIASASADLKLFKVNGAKCIDGSPAAYYLARNESSANLVVGGFGWFWVVETSSGTHKPRHDFFHFTALFVAF